MATGEPTSGPENPPEKTKVQKIKNPEGSKTIVCWNCLSILMVQSEWSVVECTTCGKYNRVPSGDYKDPKNVIVLNENLNHFDLKVPYVYGIITCPYCQTENRFRRDAEHIVCYKCHHSFSSTEKGLRPENSYHGSGLNNYHIGQGPLQIGPGPGQSQNYMRYSDMFYPDIMRYRGYYPQPYIIPTCNCDNTAYLLKKLIKAVKKSNQRPLFPMPTPPPSNLSMMRGLIKDLEDISENTHNNRYNDKYDSNEFGYNSYVKKNRSYGNLEPRSEYINRMFLGGGNY